MIIIEYRQSNLQETREATGEDIFDAFEELENQLEIDLIENPNIKHAIATNLVIKNLK